MKLFLGNVKIVVDTPEQSSYLLINETENNKQPGDKMALAQVRSDTANKSKPWTALIWEDEIRGVMAPPIEEHWKTRKEAQEWVDEYNRTHKLVRKDRP